ncbi:hypothetical protein OG312_00380 [Kocuria rhizophila]|uniref:hypothetical protein n=1 Tax=Kocuria rhizophila TaxID=72000 RepID=UPI001394A4D9|nr:hypothetical protein [Kocuria rhizophila]MXN61681.1 hypothetical protein [Bacillus sp. BGMRC0062]WSQ05172.1 hypothetical protein OG312_00380 [Kocuria rhizophila]
MVAYQPYPRGFLLTSTGLQLRIPEGWTSIPMPCQDWQFSHDHYYQPDLTVNDDASRWVLVHGLCLYAGPDELPGTVADHLLERWEQSDEKFLDALDELGGRHLIVRGTKEMVEVFHDAQGLRSVYSSREAQAVGSHAHLINSLHPHPVRGDDEGARALTHSWDRTRYVGIEPLLPNHRLRLPSWEVDRFFPRARNAYQDWHLDSKLQKFQQMWTAQMTRLSSLGSDLVMSITGGADSRTSLALSADHIDNIKFFTYTAKRVAGSKWSDSLALDKELVEQLKELVPFNHRYFESEQRDRALIARLAPLLEVNTTQQHSRWLVAFYAAAFPEEGCTHIRGNGYEIGRAYWGAREDNDNMSSLRNLYMQITKGDQDHVEAQARRDYFEQGVRKWGYDGDRFGYHIRDLAYWELRSGRWLSEIMNETDIAFETFVPLNVRLLLDITLSMNIQERQETLLFSELINRAKPILNFPGKNDIRNLYEQMRDDRLEQLGRHVAADSAHLEGSCVFSSAGGDVAELPAVWNELVLPAERFLPGARVSRALVPSSSSSPQTLSFVVESPYCNPRALGKFVYEVYLNGEKSAAWDGAAFNRPVHVTIDNLTREDTVSVAVRSLSNQRGRVSWEKASRATIRDFRYARVSSSSMAKAPAVWTDAPQSE